MTPRELLPLVVDNLNRGYPGLGYLFEINFEAQPPSSWVSFTSGHPGFTSYVYAMLTWSTSREGWEFWERVHGYYKSRHPLTGRHKISSETFSEILQVFMAEADNQTHAEEATVLWEERHETPAEVTFLL